VETYFKQITDALMLNKYDDKKAKILEDNINSAVILMADTNKEVRGKMEEILEMLEEQRLDKLIPLEEGIKAHGQEIGIISKRIEVAENWMDNIVSVKQPETYWSKAEMEKFKKIKDKVWDRKIEIGLLKEDVNK